MVRQSEKKPALMFFAGLSAGLLLGLGVLVFLLVGGYHGRAWQETPIFAVATHSGDSFAMATGPIDDEMEGIFTLDFLTGDLKGRVLNSRSGKFTASFEHNVLNDLGVQQGKKNLEFTITTGVANFLRGSGASRPARSVIYVADCNSGNVAAYSFLWNRNLATTVRTQSGTFALLDTFRGRTVLLRE